MQSALGLVFDPRYRDFPFAPLTGRRCHPAVDVTTLRERPRGPRARPQSVAAGTLVLAAIYIVFNESFANWQALWFCAGFAVLAVTLLRVRAAPG